MNKKGQILPVPSVIPTHLLLTEKSSVAVKLGSSEATTENLTLRATKVTVILKEIQGYNHWGLNE